MSDTDAIEISSEERERKIDEMREWFYENYEDPANNVPYCSQEGGYMYLGRGPYEAKDVLFDQFGHDVPEDVIDELVQELENECVDWASIDRGDDWEDFDYALNADYFDQILGTLETIKREVNTVSPTPSGTFLNALLFVHVITCLETYLYDALQDCLSKQKFLRSFVENYSDFKSHKIPVSAIFRTRETLEDLVKGVIHKVVFHRLKQVQSLYKATLGTDIPTCDSVIKDAIEKRHGIVHHNCRDKDNNPIVISKGDVIGLISKVEAYVRAVNRVVTDRLNGIDIL